MFFAYGAKIRLQDSAPDLLKPATTQLSNALTMLYDSLKQASSLDRLRNLGISELA